MHEIEKILEYKFKNENHLKLALTHKSFKGAQNNERLEFLGDAVMDLIVAEYLYEKFRHTQEGDLSKLRAALVNEKSFAKFARKLKIGENLFLSLGEEHNGGRKKDSILSDAFEAIFGAIYLESGLEVCKSLSIKILEEIFPQIDKSLYKDFKTELQEITQANFALTPTYKLLSATGPDHKKEFEMAVFFDNKKIAAAKGKSKKEAEQKAAKIAIEIATTENIK